jgi:hypothetical protein
MLDGEARNFQRLVLVEESEVFLCEIADRVTSRIANHYRHKHRVHTHLDDGSYLRGLLRRGNGRECEESYAAGENGDTNWSAIHLAFGEYLKLLPEPTI